MATENKMKYSFREQAELETQFQLSGRVSRFAIVLIDKYTRLNSNFRSGVFIKCIEDILLNREDTKLRLFDLCNHLMIKDRKDVLSIEQDVIDFDHSTKIFDRLSFINHLFKSYNLSPPNDINNEMLNDGLNTAVQLMEGIKTYLLIRLDLLHFIFNLNNDVRKGGLLTTINEYCHKNEIARGFIEEDKECVQVPSSC
jgi:hypothetical protein